MATMAENVIAAGSENRPLMLEKGKYDSWKTRIILYIRGKENGDILTSEPEVSIHSYYLRYAKLINDMNMISMSMSNMQINTKFVNHLQPEWSRFVTAAKQARDLHVVNFNQLYAFLRHNEKDAKEVREMQQRFLDSLALLANTYNPPPSYNNQNIHYVPTIVPQQPPILPTQHDSRFVVPTDDPIASLNKVMIFLSSAYSSRFPPTNNQLTTCPIYEHKLQFKTAKFRFRMFKEDSLKVMRAMLERVKLHEQGLSIQLEREKQINQGKRVKDIEWFKDKMLLAQAQEASVVLNEEQQEFLADHVDAYDSNCEDQATASVIFMASLSLAGSLNDDTIAPTYETNILSEVPHYDTYHDDVLNSDVHETEYNEHSISHDDSYAELKKQLYWSSTPSLPESISKPNLPKKLPSTSQVLKNLQNARDLLSKFDDCIKRRTTLSPHEIGNWETTDIKGAFTQDVIPFFKNLRETFKLFEKGLYNEVKEMKDIFKQMEDEVDQCFMEKKCFEIEKKQLLINNDRLLEENISCDIMCTYLRSLNKVDNYGKCKSVSLKIC
ncbi:hypothetical protein Tco_0997307 [Tanacetum coccineum]